jgi:fructose-bisphosphate aldolase class II
MRLVGELQYIGGNMLVSSKEIIQKAYGGGYAVGAFNVSNLETLKAVIQAAEAKKSPVILATTETIISYAGLPYIFSLMKTAAEVASVPIAIHLDHGKSVETVRKCVDLGYTSVMIDGSHLELAENIALTKQAAELAHAQNVPIEGEIGELLEDKSKMADPIEAKEFVTQTGVDFLAPSVGTSHGLNANEKVDLELLQRIKEQVSIPLVLHGASGVSEDDIRKAITLGISKINIHTELRLAFIAGMKEGLTENPNTDDHRVILKVCIEKMQHVVEGKIELFGSSGKV